MTDHCVIVDDIDDFDDVDDIDDVDDVVDVNINDEHERHVCA